MREKSEIKDEIRIFLKNRFPLNEFEEIEKYSLLHPKIGLMPRDLVMIFFELQDMYNIKFTEEDILEKRFDEFDTIVDVIYHKIHIDKAVKTYDTAK